MQLRGTKNQESGTDFVVLFTLTIEKKISNYKNSLKYIKRYILTANFDFVSFLSDM